jgi:hypothetical protein
VIINLKYQLNLKAVHLEIILIKIIYKTVFLEQTLTDHKQSSEGKRQKLLAGTWQMYWETYHHLFVYLMFILFSVYKRRSGNLG